jgi:gamma-glutamyltranspeptidase
MGKEHASRLRSKIKLNATFPYQYYEVPSCAVCAVCAACVVCRVCGVERSTLLAQDLVNFTAPIEDAGTTHLSVIDSQRNAVSLTSTVALLLFPLSFFCLRVSTLFCFVGQVNLVFGAKFLSTSTGVVLNNQVTTPAFLYAYLS